MSKVITPELGAKSFSCPHCGAIAHQIWQRVFIDSYDRGGSPTVARFHPFDESNLDRLESEQKKRIIEFAYRLKENVVTYEALVSNRYVGLEMANLVLSHCVSCKGFAVWIEDRLLYPAKNTEIVPHADMPETVKADFDEAASIVDKSPRGAAALLRLCIQKLMPILGEKGDNLNDDIASLVEKGLDPMIQQALDVVRVIGNNAVHAGQIDLQDDKATAVRLFDLVNLIVETRIAVPKRIEELYQNLPEGARSAIEKRDKPTN
jgi:hypothetical protein